MPLSEHLTTDSSLSHPEPAALQSSEWWFTSVSLPWWSDPHTLHPAALPMFTIQMKKPPCSNLNPGVARFLVVINHFWCWEANECAQMPPLSVSNQDPVMPPSIPLSRLRRMTTAAVKHSTFVANLASAIFTISCTDFRDHHQLLVSTPAVGSMTAGPGLDRRAHLWCCPGRAEPEHKHRSQEATVRFCNL